MAEATFAADSIAVAQVLANAREHEFDRLAVAVVTIDDLLAVLGLGEGERLALYAEHTQLSGEDGREYRRRKAELRRLLTTPDCAQPRRNHDVRRARTGDRLCPERNIRADELDAYVFGQVRQALLDPQQLLAGERAVLTGAPDQTELIARLNTAIDVNQAQRARLLDAYQAGLLDLDELTRRTSALTARHSQLVHERETLTTRSAELATHNRLRHRLAALSERIAASLNELDFDGRQRLLRLVVERVRVSG